MLADSIPFGEASNMSNTVASCKPVRVAEMRMGGAWVGRGRRAPTAAAASRSLDDEGGWVCRQRAFGVAGTDDPQPG